MRLFHIPPYSSQCQFVVAAAGGIIATFRVARLSLLYQEIPNPCQITNYSVVPYNFQNDDSIE